MGSAVAGLDALAAARSSIIMKIYVFRSIYSRCTIDLFIDVE